MLFSLRFCFNLTCGGPKRQPDVRYVCEGRPAALWPSTSRQTSCEPAASLFSPLAAEHVMKDSTAAQTYAAEGLRGSKNDTAGTGTGTGTRGGGTV